MHYVLTEEEYSQLVPLKDYRAALADFYIAHGQMLARGEVCNAHADAKVLWERIYEAEAKNEYVKTGDGMKETSARIEVHTETQNSACYCCRDRGCDIGCKCHISNPPLLGPDPSQTTAPPVRRCQKCGHLDNPRMRTRASDGASICEVKDGTTMRCGCQCVFSLEEVIKR